LVLILAFAPALVTQPGAFAVNIIEYPLGLAHQLTTAASPLPGHLLAGAGTPGRLAAMALLLAGAAAIAVSLARRPPRDTREATVFLALGLTLLFTLAPDARYGYYAYPAALVGWLALTQRPHPHRQPDTMISLSRGGPTARPGERGVLMAMRVDPPQRDGADTLPDPARLAEPPIRGGRVEALTGRLIKVLSRSPLARPRPAVTLSALGLAGVAFVGLCATAPRSSQAAPPVLLPLTSVARDIGAPALPDAVSIIIMYASIVLCCLGLAMMLWANSRGWSPSPRKVYAAAASAVAVLVNISPVGSGDVASYAAYGRLALLGRNPYIATPLSLPGGARNSYTAIVAPQWRGTPSVYGPIATWTQMLAAWIGGTHAWATIWILMIMAGSSFLAAGWVLLRNAANPVRAALLWTANPLLIAELVLTGHLDALLALIAIVAVVLSRRQPSLVTDVLVGLLIGASLGVKVNLLALGIAIPLLRDRDWLRLTRTAAVSAVTVAALYLLTWGTSPIAPLATASTMVGSPPWHVAQLLALHIDGPGAEHAVTTVAGFAWEPLTLALAWYLYRRLSPDVPAVVAGTCALIFAWALVAPWSMPWYPSIAWVTLALLPRNTLTRWLTLATGLLALLHFNGGFPRNPKIAPP
jgi:hypothetical protein